MHATLNVVSKSGKPEVQGSTHGLLIDVTQSFTVDVHAAITGRIVATDYVFEPMDALQLRLLTKLMRERKIPPGVVKFDDEGDKIEMHAGSPANVREWFEILYNYYINHQESVTADLGRYRGMDYSDYLAEVQKAVNAKSPRVAREHRDFDESARASVAAGMRVRVHGLDMYKLNGLTATVTGLEQAENGRVILKIDADPPAKRARSPRG